MYSVAPEAVGVFAAAAAFFRRLSRRGAAEIGNTVIFQDRG